MDYELAGVFSIDVQLLPDADVEAARRVLDETLAEFLVTGPDPERLERQRVNSLTGIVRGYESVSSKAEALIAGAVFANDPGRFREPVAAVREATSESLSALANEWLTRPYYELTGVPFTATSGSGGGGGSASGAGSDSGTGAGPAAGVADRSRLPDIEAAATLRFPDVEERELDNGIRIVLARREGLPVTDLVFRFDIGSAGETPEEQGITDFAFQQLTGGTTAFDAAELSTEMERLGTFVRATGGTLSSSLTAGGLTEGLREIIVLTADILSNPAYPEDQLALQTERAIAEIRQNRTQPRAVAMAALEEHLFGAEHPYGRQMTEEQVRNIDRSAVTDYHASLIKGSPFTVFAVGDVTMDNLAQWLADGFAGWRGDELRNPSGAGEQGETPGASPEVAPVAAPEHSRVFLVNMPGSPQSLILAGVPAAPTTVEPDVANSIANELLGGGFLSRINRNLREDKGWSYGSGSILSTDRFQPLLMVSAPVQADRTAEAIAEIQRELDEYIGSRPATAEEFNPARERRLRSLAGRFETGRSLLNSLLASAEMSRPWDYQLRYAEALQEVTLEDVRAAAQELIRPDRLTWVIAGELSLFEENVRALEIGEVTEVDVFGQPVEAASNAR